MSENIDLAGEEYWNEAFKKFDFQVAEKEHVVRQWFETIIPPGKGTCMEIGCFPGQFLACFGELGYQLYGLDRIAEVETALPAWLKSKGYKVGQFYREDFFNFETGETFDIVASFGFIEHFSQWQDALIRHIKLVKEGGCLVLSAPNFRGGFQRFFQSVFNSESYRRHNIQAMDPEAWAEIIKEQGFEILFSGYYGAIHYWANQQKRSLPAKIGVHFMIDIVRPVLKVLPLPKHRKFYSPICGVIARRVG
jgi:SAM-dependent methyltransferase